MDAQNNPPSKPTRDQDGFLTPSPLPLPKPIHVPEQFPMMHGPQRIASQSTRQKMVLAPGHSALDWAKLKKSGSDLTGGVGILRRIPLSELSLHASQQDCWMSLQGKVFNVTPYLPFHPGGVAQLMRGAGQDATKLFFDVHPWVNADRILDKCHVGYLIRDEQDVHE